MCTSETVVCYGIVMRSWQLIVAAKAFTEFSPQLRGIDIIISRQRKGTLQVTEKVHGMRSISDMPLEVLEMIRGKVFVEEELGKAAARLAGLEDWDVVDWKKIPTPPCKWSGDVNDRWSLHYDVLFEVDLRVASFRDTVTTLLAYYGLELASTETANQVDEIIEDAATSVVALHASTEKITIEVEHEGFSRANGMKLPSSSNVANRFDSAPNFRRFYRDFQFDVVSEITTTPPTASVVPAAPSIVGTSKESSGDTAGVSNSSVEEVLASIRPEWIVWTSSDSCH